MMNNEVLFSGIVLSSYAEESFYASTLRKKLLGIQCLTFHDTGVEKIPHYQELDTNQGWSITYDTIYELCLNTKKILCKCTETNS